MICTLTTIALTNPTSSRDVGMCASGCFGSKCGDLLYVEMSICVARLITCARQLLFMSNRSEQLKDERT
jgi:hypothetical protein